MKSFVVLTALSFLVLSCSQNPTNPNPTNGEVLNGWEKIKGPSRISDIYFTTPAKGFLCGVDNGYYKSTDSGRTWNKLDLPGFSGALVTFNWLNGQYAHGVGTNTFTYSTDNGETWKLKKINISSAGRDIAFATPARGIVTGDGLFLTTDTGNTWTQLYPGIWDAAAFTNNQDGWAAKRGVGLYQTHDGGVTWTLNKAMTRPVYTVFFLNDNTGWFNYDDSSAAALTVWRTTDKGVTWVSSGLQGYPRDIHFLNNQLGYVTSGDGIYKTTDGGVSWKQEVRIPGELFGELYFLNDNYGWAQTREGTVVRYKKP